MCVVSVVADLGLACSVRVAGLGPGEALSCCFSVTLKLSFVASDDDGGGLGESMCVSPVPPWFDPSFQNGAKMRKPVASSLSVSDGKPVHLAALDSPMFHQFPCLMKHMAVTRYDDGESRWPGTTIIRTEGSSWKLILKDPSTALQLTVVASTLDDALALAELLLSAEQAPWEADPNAWQPVSKTKKK